MQRRSFLIRASALALAVSAAPRALAAGWEKVLTPDALAGLDDVLILDIRPPDAYARGRVPGAVNAPYGTWRGPRENPGRALDDAQLTDRLQTLGVAPQSAVVVVHQGANQTDFGAAARVYWTLKSAGLARIAILNGGTDAWVRAGKPLSTEPVRVARSTAEFALARTWLIDRAGVRAVLTGEREAILIDARPAAFFRGEKKHPAAAAAGALKGALNLVHDEWFPDSRTEIVTGPRVLEIAKKSGHRPGGPELVSFCNTGHWAATNWFALSELAGIEGVRLYPESMVGWSNSGGALVRGG